MGSTQPIAEDLLEFALATARKHGATAADALFSAGVSTEVKVRLGNTESVKQSRSKGIGLRVFVGQRSATTSTSDLERGRLDALIQRTCEAARVVADDALSGLPSEDLFGLSADDDLDLFDESLLRLTVADALETAHECETASLEVDTRITNSEGADMSWGHSETYFANSMGVTRHKRGGSVGFWTCPIAEGDGGMERDYWYTSARHLGDLLSAKDVGLKAAERTLRRLGASQPQTATVPVIYEHTVASRLLGSLAGAICGGSIYRDLSYLAGKLNTRIAHPSVSIRDDSRIPRAPSSRPFDGEGLTTGAVDVVTEGILKSYLLDTYSARKLGLTTTRSASRGLASTPSASPSNFWMQPGQQSLEELIADVKNGVLVTELLGFGMNTVTGDYSQGASGIWIENGKLTRPVNEMTVASTLQRMWSNIDGIANDLDRSRGVSAPSFRIGNMTVGGG